jgi:hypothetical protein
MEISAITSYNLLVTSFSHTHLLQLGVIVLPFSCWDRGFESRCGHGCLSVVCCVGTDLCDGPITRSGQSYRMRVSHSV